MVIEFFSPGLPAIVAATGSDFILYDMEHSGAGFETMKMQFAGCRGIGVAPLVRVPSSEYHFVARAFDLGASRQRASSPSPTTPRMDGAAQHSA